MSQIYISIVFPPFYWHLCYDIIAQRYHGECCSCCSCYCDMFGCGCECAPLHHTDTRRVLLCYGGHSSSSIYSSVKKKRINQPLPSSTVCIRKSSLVSSSSAFRKLNSLFFLFHCLISNCHQTTTMIFTQPHLQSHSNLIINFHTRHSLSFFLW